MVNVYKGPLYGLKKNVNSVTPGYSVVYILFGKDFNHAPQLSCVLTDFGGSLLILSVADKNVENLA